MKRPTNKYKTKKRDKSNKFHKLYNCKPRVLFADHILVWTPMHHRLMRMATNAKK